MFNLNLHISCIFTGQGSTGQVSRMIQTRLAPHMSRGGSCWPGRGTIAISSPSPRSDSVVSSVVGEAMMNGSNGQGPVIFSPFYELRSYLFIYWCRLNYTDN